MRLSLRLSVFSLLLVIAAAGCYQGDSSGSGSDSGPESDGKYIHVSAGDKPVVDLKTTDGHAITGDSLRGHVVVLDFWATWCESCMQEAPHMVGLHEKYTPRGVEFVGINFDSDTSAMQKAVHDLGMTWPQVNDREGIDGAINKTWGVELLPEAVILSPSGVVLWAGLPWDIDKPLAAAVDPPPKTAGTRPATTQ